MKFKTNICKEINQSGVLTCLDWAKNDEIYTVSDDHQILKWSARTRQSQEIAKLPDDFNPTDLHWLCTSRTTPSSKITNGPAASNSASKGNDALLISSSDGRFIILNRNARVERNVAAHQGAINSIRWSPDGSGLLTAGEDGVLKIWSKLGMLRSTIIQSEKPIRCACWSPNSLSVAYSSGGHIALKPLAANSKLMKWRAHDGSVLCLSWSDESDFIASGGDDCRYKIWDSHGSLIYASAIEDYSITSLDFCPKGIFLAVGSFNSMKLCHYTGWTYSNTKFSEPVVGSLYSIRWSQDGTQVAAGSGTGALILAHITEEEKSSKNLRAKMTGRKIIELQDISSGTTDSIDFPERIIKWDVGYGHIVVATPTQVHIYNEKYSNTPLSIIDGRIDVRILLLSKKYFLIVDNSSVTIFTYTGRLHLTPKYSGLNAQLNLLTEKCVSLGLHYVAIRDYADESVIHIFDLVPGATRQAEPISFPTKTPVQQIAVCRSGNVDDQYMVLVDKNRDVFCTQLKNEPDFRIYKIGTQVISVMWSSEVNILAGLHDACYSIWYCPGESCMDPSSIALTTNTFDITDFGRNIILENFEGSIVRFKSAGVSYSIQIYLYCEILHKLLNDNLWSQGLKMCRRAQNQVLWATLASIASKKSQLEICEEAYAASLQIDKVMYLQHIKNLPPNSYEQMAEKSVMMGRNVEAETILIHNNKASSAIELCIRMHRWERALEIAKSTNQAADMDLVLDERKKYLKVLDRDEYLEPFLKLE